jgi:hypothetical protein
VDLLPGGWEAVRIVGKSLSDEMALRAITLTGAAMSSGCQPPKGLHATPLAMGTDWNCDGHRMI